MKEKLQIAGIVFAIFVLALVLVNTMKDTNTPLGSINDGQAYYASTTDATWTGAKLLKSGPGTLGSVVFTGVGSSVNSLKIYDATTTDITQRTGQKATSTIKIVDFGVQTTRGTYTFDIQINDGILVEPSITGGVASTTITFR